jgi:uncharacterized caspase-like protein
MRDIRVAAAIAWSVLVLLLGLGPAAAEKRVALVIGNGAYKSASKLTNPTNDAKAIAGMLQVAGFDTVELYENLGIRELRRAISNFSAAARDADMAIVYYSGHGIEVDGVNYLIPIDAVLETDGDVTYETFSLDNLLKVLEPVKRLRLVMLDACRDNPFARSMKRSVGTRSVGRGLAAIEPTSVNTLIGFAAKAGSYALDGEGVNSPYATAVLNNVATPGLDLRIAFGRVRDEVLKSTKNKQEPFVYGSLGGSNISIVDAPAASNTGTIPPSQAPVPSIDRAAQAWAATKDTTSPAILEDFIKHFGSTVYGSMARARLQELRAAAPKPPDKVAVAAPTVRSGAQDGVKGPYGAIAYSPGNGTYGSALQYANRPLAEQQAMRECGKSDCQIAAWFFNSCGALATDSDGAWGADYNNDEQRARALAQARCAKEGGANCKIVYSICSQ